MYSMALGWVPTTPACTWWNRPEEYNSSGKLESTHPSRTSVKSDKVFLGVESVMRVNADSLLIRAAATSTSGTLNDLTTDLIMANNNNNMALGPRFFKWKMLSLSGPKALLFLQLLIALLTRSVVNVCAISNDFLFVSLVTNRVSPEEVCLPSFDVLNCWLNLVASCLDDESEIPLKVIASFSASRFALPSIPLIDLHSLVTSVFWSKVSTKSLHFCLLCA